MTKRRHVLSIREGKWAAIPGLAALVAGALLLSAYSGASSSQGRGPDQPLAFPHPVHVKNLGMNCLYCHSAANKSPDPGLPAVGTCAGCHSFVGPDRPKSDLGEKRRSAAIAKLWEFADIKGVGMQMGPNAKPIPWERIHKVPEYVRFPHMRHVNAGVTCQTCHGDIQNMAKVSQAATLNMGWCVNCHVKGYDPAEGRRLTGATDASAPATPPVSAAAASDTTLPSAQRRKARYDCAICHY